MSRPAMRHPTGKWSLSQVHTEAGVTLAIARRVAGLGWLDADDLTVDDVVVLKVADALLGAPKPSGPRRTHPSPLGRDERALTLARECVRARAADKDLTLVITPHNASLAKDFMALMNTLNEASDAPRLLLPLGAWIAAMPTLSTEQVAS